MSSTHIIPDIDQYTIEIRDNTLFLHRKIRDLTSDELSSMSFAHSTLVHCIVQHTTNGQAIISTDRTKFRHVLTDVFAAIPMPLLRQVTTFKMEPTNMHGVNGYQWCEPLGLSIQGKDATSTLREIVRLVELNQYSLEVVVELRSGDRVRVMR